MDIDIKKPYRKNMKIHGDIYMCPACRHFWIFANDNYCSECGCKLNWNKNSVKQTIRID